jgi:hypothetical protein
MKFFAEVCIGVALVAAIACARSDPERELRETVASMASAIERREPGAFLAGLADDFSRESGAFGKDDVKRVLAGVFLRNEKIHVTAIVTDVMIDGAQASARIRVLATGGQGLLPERGQSWDFDTAWRQDKGRWVIYNAEWRDAI